MFKDKTKSSVHSMLLVIGTLHPHMTYKTVDKWTLRRQSAMEGGESSDPGQC